MTVPQEDAELNKLMNEFEDAVWCSRGEVSTQNIAAANRAHDARAAIQALFTQRGEEKTQLIGTAGAHACYCDYSFRDCNCALTDVLREENKEEE